MYHHHQRKNIRQNGTCSFKVWMATEIQDLCSTDAAETEMDSGPARTKYRLSKNLYGQANIGSNKASTADRVPEVQRHLQLRIEAQGKYLQTVLEKAQENLGKQNLGNIDLEVAKIQLSDFVSKVSNGQCLNSAISEMKELSDLCLQQTQTAQPTNCSTHNGLNSCKGSMRDQERYTSSLGLKPLNFRAPTEPRANENETRTGLRWHEDLKGCRNYLSDNAENEFARENGFDNLSMNIGKWNGNGNHTESDAKFSYQNTDNIDLMKPEKQKTTQELKLPFFSTKLDLNIDDEDSVASSCKQLDLNGFSWSWNANIVRVSARHLHDKEDKRGLEL
ncbi:hypothetical protein DH2020_039882 [Rehmannia glutinosa]|uniref:MYB-CC type transcription factor LHEQLE-containing domain-containing protein n=1 Tax=Rehmannia glutinosa TaxID=99300 RepID=A0ABR0UVP5_REHGL